MAGAALLLLAVAALAALAAGQGCPPAITAFLDNSVTVRYFKQCTNNPEDPDFTGERPNLSGGSTFFNCIDQSTNPGSPQQQWGYMRVEFTTQLDAYDIKGYWSPSVPTTQLVPGCPQGGTQCGCRYVLRSDQWQALGLGGVDFPGLSTTAEIEFYAEVRDYFYRLGWGASPAAPNPPYYVGLRIPTGMDIFTDTSSAFDCGLSHDPTDPNSYCVINGCRDDPLSPSSCGPLDPCCFNQTCTGEQQRPPYPQDIFSATNQIAGAPTAPGDRYVEADVAGYLFQDSSLSGSQLTAAINLGSGYLQCAPCPVVIANNGTLRNCTMGGIDCEPADADGFGNNTIVPPPTNYQRLGINGNREAWYWLEPTWRVLELQALPEFRFDLQLYVNHVGILRTVVINGDAAGIGANSQDAGEVTLSASNQLWLERNTAVTQNDSFVQFQGAFQKVDGVIVLRECGDDDFEHPCNCSGSGCGDNNRRWFNNYYDMHDQCGNNNDAFNIRDCHAPLINITEDPLRGVSNPVDTAYNGSADYFTSGVPRQFYWAQRGRNGFRISAAPTFGERVPVQCNDLNAGPDFVALATATQNMCQDRYGTCVPDYDWWSVILNGANNALTEGEPQNSVQTINDIRSKYPPRIIDENVQARINASEGGPLPNIMPELVPSRQYVAVWPVCSTDYCINGQCNTNVAYCHERGGGDYRLRFLSPGPKDQSGSGKANDAQVLRVSARLLNFVVTATVGFVTPAEDASIAPAIGCKEPADTATTPMQIYVRVTRTDALGGTATFTLAVDCIGQNADNPYATVEVPSRLVPLNATAGQTEVIVVFTAHVINTATAQPQCHATLLNNQLLLASVEADITFTCDTSDRPVPPSPPTPPPSCSAASCDAVLGNLSGTVPAPVACSPATEAVTCPARQLCRAGFCAIPTGEAPPNDQGCTPFDVGIALCSVTSSGTCRLGKCTAGNVCDVATEPYASLPQSPCGCTCAGVTPPPTPAGPTPAPTPAPCSGIGCWSDQAKAAFAVGIALAAICLGGCCCLFLLRFLGTSETSAADQAFALDASKKRRAGQPRVPTSVITTSGRAGGSGPDYQRLLPLAAPAQPSAKRRT